MAAPRVHRRFFGRLYQMLTIVHISDTRIRTRFGLTLDRLSARAAAIAGITFSLRLAWSLVLLRLSVPAIEWRCRGRIS